LPWIYENAHANNVQHNKVGKELALVFLFVPLSLKINYSHFNLCSFIYKCKLFTYSTMIQLIRSVFVVTVYP